MLSEQVLQEIEQSLAAATPGPWRACQDGECPCGFVWSLPRDCIVSVPPPDDYQDVTLSQDEIKANAKLIALLRNNAAALVTALREARAEIATLRGDLNELSAWANVARGWIPKWEDYDAAPGDEAVTP